MKKLLHLMTTAALVLAADHAAVAGKWQVHSNIAGNESDSTCTFTQKDNDLTGSCAGEQGSKDITGKVEGKKISWSFKSEYNGTPLTVQYEGTLNGDGKIVGTTTVPEFAVDGDFTATRAQ